MTDRIKAFTVVLDEDYRTDDVEQIHKALLMIKGVLSVEPLVADAMDHVARQRARAELTEKLLAVLR